MASRRACNLFSLVLSNIIGKVVALCRILWKSVLKDSFLIKIAVSDNVASCRHTYFHRPYADDVSSVLRNSGYGFDDGNIRTMRVMLTLP